MSVADTSQSNPTLAETGGAPMSSPAKARRDPGKPESRACIFHICGGIAMLAAGVALLIIV